MCNRTKRILAAAMVAVSATTIVLAQPAPSTPSAAEQPADAKPVSGTVTSYNLSADGEPNGLLLKTGDGPLTQVNFPPHMAAQIVKAAKVGGMVSVTTRPVPPRPAPGGPGGPGAGPAGGPAAGPDADRPAPPPPPPADHRVMELVSITPDGGAVINVTRPEDGPTQHADGKVARLNYARDGQVDGAVLEDGTLIHVGPKEAEDLKLAVGQSLSVDGTKPAKAGDAKVLHATNVNGTKIERPKPRGPGGPGGPKDAPPAP